MPNAQLQVRNHLNDAAAFPWDFMTAVRGFEADGSGPGDALALAASNPAPGGSWNATLPAAVAALAVPGSDVLLLGGSGAQAWPLVDPFTQGAQIFVQTGNDIAQGDVLLVTDCSQGFVFQASNVAQAGGKTNVTGAKGGLVVPGNSDAISEQGPNGGAFRHGAMVARASRTAYFIGAGSNGSPALFRASLLPADGNANARLLRSEELITGIESMQLLYGLDTDGNFAVDQYRSGVNIVDWGEVRTVRVAFLARAENPTLQADDTGTYPMLGTTVDPVDDRRQRRVFEITISLRNRLP
jgi:type IV pilus assembly protein PilW